MARRKVSYKTKRANFHGNQHSRNIKKQNVSEENKVSSASKRKIGYRGSVDIERDSECVGNMIIDIGLMSKEIMKCLRCVCGGKIEIKLGIISGLDCKFLIVCENCLEVVSFSNCPMIGKSKNVFEVNRRAVYAMRCVGQGFTGLQIFCGIMNMRPPVKKTTYSIINNKINIATKAVKRQSMSKAAKEEIVCSDGTDLSVTCDGTWITKGYNSQHGVCTVIGSKSGKVIDTKVLSTHCKACEPWKNKNTTAYAEWWEGHESVCPINHAGTSGGMEVEGMKKIFLRSQSKHGVRYVNYIGDGDTKSFKAVSELQPYGSSVPITKIECVGHVQKRMGTQLRNKKAEYKGKKLSDGKSLSGKNRLTDSVINTLTCYYGNAIRSNAESVSDMRTAIWAIWYHKSSSDSNPMHYLSPKGENSWCPYQRAVSNGTEQLYKHKNTIPVAVMEAIKPVFKNLVSTEPITRCLGGYTQNPNESLNSKIWKICPKIGFCGKTIVKIETNDGVITFNDGMMARMNVLSEMGIVPGEFCKYAMHQADVIRIKSAEKKSIQTTKEARQCRKRLKLEEVTQKPTKEGASYAAGGF